MCLPSEPRASGQGQGWGWRPGAWVLRTLCLAPQAPSEYETSPEQLFYRIAHLTRGQPYLLWVAAVTSAGRGNSSEKVVVEPTGKGERPGLGQGTEASRHSFLEFWFCTNGLSPSTLSGAGPLPPSCIRQVWASAAPCCPEGLTAALRLLWCTEHPTAHSTLSPGLENGEVAPCSPQTLRPSSSEG